MTIILVRHGETAFNRDGQGLGRSDVPLTEVGQAQGRAIARRLTPFSVGRVVTSPLSRAATFAEWIAAEHGVAVEASDALLELDVGETEGMGFPEMRERFPEFLSTWAGPEGWKARMPGGESIQDLGLRLQPLVAELLLPSESDTVVVSHNFVLRTILCLLLKLDLERFRAFQVDLASATFLTVRNGRVSVTSVNDTCHLVNLSVA
ncbi:MAG: histidine phosphatase family protein [bacterium]